MIRPDDPLMLAKEGDPYRRDGELATCDGCGVMVRWIEIRKKDGTGGRMCVAPYPLPGNWGRAVVGYGEGRADGREPETTGPLWVVHKGVGSYWRNPPPTVSGYRAHWADCPGKDTFRRPASAEKPAAEAATS